MNILIDGYNLLKQALGKKEISDKERRWFYHQALSYARRKGHNLHIIYDGGPYTRFTKEITGNVTILYSGYKDTADDIIKNYIDYQVLKNVLLVTTDRQLNAYADTHGVPSIDSLDFYPFLTQQPPEIKKLASSQAQKLTTDSTPELDQLMHQGSQHVPQKQEIQEEAEHVRASKHEKKLLALLKKL